MRWLLFVLVAGCTRPNTHFHSGDLGTTQGPHLDGSTLSSSDAAMQSGVDSGPSADLAMPQPCDDGPRRCGNGGSQVCTNGAYVPDRGCPQDGTCSAGYCQPPNTHSCSVDGLTSETLCASSSNMGGGANLVCQPFVGGSSVVWECATPIGMGGGGKPCNSGWECRSGICADHTCFRVCTSGDVMGCAQGTQCEDLSIVVEGVTIATQGCIPQG